MNGCLRNTMVSLAVLIMLLFAGGAPAADDGKAGSVAEYQRLADRLKSGDTAIDYTRLRYAFVRTADYNPYDKLSAERAAMITAMEGKDFVSALNHARSVLDRNYLDMEAHFFSNIANRELGNGERQRFHTAVLKGLMASLYGSGDGQSMETAYTVISTDEEYFMLRINGYKVMQQKLMQKDGVHYDAMDVEHLKSGARTTIYFNVEFPFAWLNERMKKK